MSGVRPHGSSRYRHGPDQHGTPGRGCRCLECRRGRKAEEVRRERLIAAGVWEGYVDATGTRRRLQALTRCGWPLAKLAGAAGVSRAQFVKIIHPGRLSAVRPATAKAVAVLYDELWDTQPPRRGRYDRAGSARAANRAKARGWPPPAAWDDSPGPHCIDDPEAVPAPGWERGGRREWGAIAEDAAELDGQGVHPEMIAARLGVKAKTVERTLERARAGSRPGVSPVAVDGTEEAA